jgi:hypothetical protein
MDSLAASNEYVDPVGSDTPRNKNLVGKRTIPPSLLERTWGISRSIRGEFPRKHRLSYECKCEINKNPISRFDPYDVVSNAFNYTDCVGPRNPQCSHRIRGQFPRNTFFIKLSTGAASILTTAPPWHSIGRGGSVTIGLSPTLPRYAAFISFPVFEKDKQRSVPLKSAIEQDHLHRTFRMSHRIDAFSSNLATNDASAATTEAQPSFDGNNARLTGNQVLTGVKAQPACTGVCRNQFHCVSKSQSTMKSGDLAKTGDFRRMLLLSLLLSLLLLLFLLA